MSAFESGVMAPHIPHPLISIASFSPLAVVQIEDSLTARFARGSFILSVMTVQDVPLALWRARLAALACDSTTAEGRAVARPEHIGPLVPGIASDRRERAIRAVYLAPTYLPPCR